MKRSRKQSQLFYELFFYDLSLLKEDVSHLNCLGIITHSKKKFIDTLFSQLSSNSSSSISLVYKEGESFLGIAHRENNLYLFSNRDILSPTLFSKAMAILLFHMNRSPFSKYPNEGPFFLEKVQVSISSSEVIDDFSNYVLAGSYDHNDKCIYLKQKEKKEVYNLFARMCSHVIDLALPVSRIGAEKINGKYFGPLSYLEERIYFYKSHNIKLEKPENISYTYNGKEYVLPFREIEKGPNYYSFVPLISVSKTGFIIPSVEQIKQICAPMELLQKKIYMRVLKKIGPFSPISYGYDNQIFFSLAIVIQMGSLLEKGFYNKQDNLILLSNVTDYLNSLESRNVEETPIYRYD